MRVRPTHYTIGACDVKSWIVEGSEDGQEWTEIDRRIDNQDFSSWTATAASFDILQSSEFRFIRLTQTGKRHDGRGYLSLRAVEFFGTLFQ
jgi:hypothetical protein